MAATVERLRQGALSGSVADVVATVPYWWRRRAAACGLESEWQSLDRAVQAPALPAAGAPRNDLLDASATELGEAYAAALDSSTRLRDGRHYTPATLAAALWAEVEEADSSTAVIFDPACGAGSLLLPPLRAALSATADPAEVLATIGSRISGSDLDPVAVWIGNVALAAELLPSWACIPPPRNGDRSRCFCAWKTV